MDALIAEKVMELQRCDKVAAVVPPEQCSLHGVTHYSADWIHSRTGEGLPAYSVDNAAALTALDKLSEDGWYRQVIERTPRGWEVGLDNGRDFVTGQGSTLALAAGRAALNATDANHA